MTLWTNQRQRVESQRAAAGMGTDEQTEAGNNAESTPRGLRTGSTSAEPLEMRQKVGGLLASFAKLGRIHVSGKSGQT